MASIPLSGIAPPVQNPMAMYAQLMNIRAMQQEQQTRQLQQQGLQLENQQRQLALQDQQGMARAYMDAQGDPDKFLGNLQSGKYGVSFNGIMTANQTIRKAQTDLLALNEKQFQQHQQIADLYNGFIQQVKDAPPAQRAQVWAQGAGQFQGLPDVQIPAQYPGDQNLDMLQYHGITLTKTLENASKQAEAFKNTSEGNLAAAKTPGAQAESAIQQQEAAITPAQRALQPNLYYQASQGTPGAQAALNLETNQKERVARAEGQVRLDIMRQASGSGGALANVPPHLVPAATAAATKAGEDYAQSKSISDRMAAMMNAARSGNVVSYKIIPEEGALQITTSQGVHRINMTEIEQYGGGGSLWQRMLGKFDKATSGQSIPPSVLSDMATIQDLVAKGSRSKYENSLRTINQNYGSTFQPVNMGGLDGGAGAGGGGQLSPAAQKFISKYQ